MCIVDSPKTLGLMETTLSPYGGGGPWSSQLVRSLSGIYIEEVLVGSELQLYLGEFHAGEVSHPLIPDLLGVGTVLSDAPPIGKNSLLTGWTLLIGATGR